MLLQCDGLSAPCIHERSSASHGRRQTVGSVLNVDSYAFARALRVIWSTLSPNYANVSRERLPTRLRRPKFHFARDRRETSLSDMIERVFARGLDRSDRKRHRLHVSSRTSTAMNVESRGQHNTRRKHEDKTMAMHEFF